LASLDNQWSHEIDDIFYPVICYHHKANLGKIKHIQRGIFMQNEQELPEIDSPDEQKTILLIEDHPVFSKIMKHMITTYTPHRVVHLSDGEQIREALDESRPHLLVLDYDLPGMNGLEIYDLVHGIEEWQDIPAIMVSANVPLHEIERRRIAGLSKPCKVDELVSAIVRALN
jgi:CheY-like chemotaxis protein